MICSDCPVFVVTQKNDDAERKRVAEMLTKQYRTEYKLEDISCDGCIGDSSHIWQYCSACEVRKCAREKNVENCTCCPEYSCERLSRFFSRYSRTKEIWDKIRREVVGEQLAK